jgi:hypothetical protein
MSAPACELESIRAALRSRIAHKIECRDRYEEQDPMWLVHEEGRHQLDGVLRMIEGLLDDYAGPAWRVAT